MPLSILIVGCSVAGPALASFLQMAPFPPGQRPRITVLERAPAVRNKGQNVDVRGVGAALLRKLGIEKAVKASTTGEAGVQWVTSAGHVWAQLGGASDGDTGRHNPTSDIEILRGRMAQILWKRSTTIADTNAVEYIFGDHLDGIEQDHTTNTVTVHFARAGTKRTFDLVVGADGLLSSTRSMVWGPDHEADCVRPLHMYAGFFSLPQDAAAGDGDYRRCYHTHGRRLLSIRPERQNHRSTALLTVVNETDERLAKAAQGHGKAVVAAQKELIRDYFADAGWQAPRLVREMMASDDFYYSMVAQVKMATWHRGRVVLLGDAAHCASHLSGMGTTLALLGAYHLAASLAQHADDVETALAAYEADMRPHVDKAQKLMPGLLRILSPATAWGVWLVDTTIRFLVWSRLFLLVLLFNGPGTGADALPEDGFTQPPEYEE
ncbi:hypothetical protein SPBR_00657 [Sporothrix brasiliensis 5110]|uniref:FAD-binding domain-containing protein n=1 Tax=Sporothrix brasiliensis 5110 TaxID=1398154 RepID=A0A0C2ILL4_9PEZI|nr:uncharacterized protein SPBR_00657 [Sporothrix brasiliensis 5110]KIH89981.1 hypothetical protein SPBR_00657 [Sporothrix brasiliensis 5110]